MGFGILAREFRVVMRRGSKTPRLFCRAIYSEGEGLLVGYAWLCLLHYKALTN